MIRISWKAKTLRLFYPIVSFDSCLFGHDWSGWYELLSRESVGKRHRQCKRCGKIETGE